MNSERAPVAVLRADASAEIGGGHVMRCLSLAAALTDAGWDCRFAVNSGAVDAVPHLEYSGHAVIEPVDPTATALAEALGEAVDLMIIDHYGLDRDFEAACRPFARRILVIDDLVDRAHDCDVLVDTTLGRTASDYAALVPAGCRVLAGVGYSLLAPHFRRLRSATLARRREGRLDRLLVTFGLLDHAGGSVFALDALLAMPARAFAIDIAVGSACPHLPALRERLAAVAGNDVVLHVDSKAMAELMAAADLVVGAGGTTSWERCCLGLPAVTLAVADNQNDNLAALVTAGVIVALGRFGDVTGERLAAAVADLGRDAARLVSMSVRAGALVDGLGAARVAIECRPPPLASDGRPVYLRPLRSADSDLMFAWQTMPGARALSGNPEPPTESEHQRWFAAKMADPGCIMHMVEHGGEAAGVLRFDRNEHGHHVASILVSKDKQRLGIGTAALELGNRLLGSETLDAVIHPENTSSLRIFERAGYLHLAGNRYQRRPFGRK